MSVVFSGLSELLYDVSSIADGPWQLGVWFKPSNAVQPGGEYLFSTHTGGNLENNAWWRDNGVFKLNVQCDNGGVPNKASKETSQAVAINVDQWNYFFFEVTDVNPSTDPSVVTVRINGSAPTTVNVNGVGSLVFGDGLVVGGRNLDDDREFYGKMAFLDIWANGNLIDATTRDDLEAGNTISAFVTPAPAFSEDYQTSYSGISQGPGAAPTIDLIDNPPITLSADLTIEPNEPYLGNIDLGASSVVGDTVNIVPFNPPGDDQGADRGSWNIRFKMSGCLGRDIVAEIDQDPPYGPNLIPNDLKPWVKMGPGPWTQLASSTHLDIGNSVRRFNLPTATSDVVYFAIHRPYTPQDISDWHTSNGANSLVHQTASSVGNFIRHTTVPVTSPVVPAQSQYATRITDLGVQPLDGKEKLKVVMVAGLHAAETPGQMFVLEVMNYLLTPAAADIVRDCDFYFYHLACTTSAYIGYPRYGLEEANNLLNPNRVWGTNPTQDQVAALVSDIMVDTGGGAHVATDNHSKKHGGSDWYITTGDTIVTSIFAFFDAIQTRWNTAASVPDVGSFRQWSADVLGCQSSWTTEHTMTQSEAEIVADAAAFADAIHNDIALFTRADVEAYVPPNYDIFTLPGEIYRAPVRLSIQRLGNGDYNLDVVECDFVRLTDQSVIKTGDHYGKIGRIYPFDQAQADQYTDDAYLIDVIAWDTGIPTGAQVTVLEVKNVIASVARNQQLIRDIEESGG